MRPPPCRRGIARSSSSTSSSARRSTPEPAALFRARRCGLSRRHAHTTRVPGAVPQDDRNARSRDQGVRHPRRRAARKAADASTRRYKAGRPLSPIDGCPVAVKDIIATADMPTQMNSPIYKGWRPKADAACVAALRQAGAVIVGKTVTTEFAIGRSGPTRNPFDTTRTPGGSSSGSAAAVACGMVPVGPRHADAGIGASAGGLLRRRRLQADARSAAHGRDPSAVDDLGPSRRHRGKRRGCVARRVADFARRTEPGRRISQRRWRRFARFAPTEKTDPVCSRAGGRRPTTETRVGFDAFVDRVKARGIDVTSRDEDHEVAELEHQFEKELDGHVDLDRLRDAVALRGLSRAVRSRAWWAPVSASFSTAREVLLPVTMRRFLRRAIGCSAPPPLCSPVATASSRSPARDRRPAGSRRLEAAPFRLTHHGSACRRFRCRCSRFSGLPVGVQLIGRAGADSTLCAIAQWMMTTAHLADA